MISKASWIMVGVLLWGIPTAIFFAMFLAVLKPGSWDQIQPFDLHVFFQKLLWTLPIFAIGGLVYGLFMEYKSRDKM
jgi:hypothetical protein